MRRILLPLCLAAAAACAPVGPDLEARFQSIEPGRTTASEVRRLLGPPLREVDFDNLGQVAWDYRFRDTWGYLADFSVMVGRDGVVASKIVARIEPRGRF